MERKNTWGMVFQWALMNTIGLALGIAARQFFFPLSAGLPGYRLLIEGFVLGLVMALLQTYAFSQYERPYNYWFWLSWLGWTIGWAYGWTWGWRIFGSQGLHIVMMFRGLLVGLLVGGLQWLSLRQWSTWANVWLGANVLAWPVGFWLASTIGGAFSWMIGAAISSVVTGLAMKWIVHNSAPARR
ncbi:MAG: hypothetical protein AAF629_15215 [Chloroflexota bacterium]